MMLLYFHDSRPFLGRILTGVLGLGLRVSGLGGSRGLMGGGGGAVFEFLRYLGSFMINN